MKKFFAVFLAGLTAASMAAAATAAIPEGLVVHEWVEGFPGEGAENLFDYDETTKWCHGSPWSYVIWEMPEAVEVTGYQIVTANEHANYPGRNPSAWTLYGCNDYDPASQEGSWEEIDVVEGDTILEDVDYTPYTFMLDAAAPSYKFYQLEINEISGGQCFQMSGFNLLYDGKAAQEILTDEEKMAKELAAKADELIAAGYKGAVTLKPVEGIQMLEGTPGFNGSEGPEYLFDAAVNTKWCSNAGDFFVTWQMPEAVEITGYQIVTANDTADYPDRNPTGWTLSGSTDGETWNVIDTRADETTLLAQNFLPVDFMLDAAAPAYTYFKLDNITLPGDMIQISGLGLIYDGAVLAEAVAPQGTAPVVEETEAPAVEETEAPAAEETEAPVVEETEAPVAEEIEDKAPQTFDIAVIAGAAALVSLAGYAVSKKH